MKTKNIPNEFQHISPAGAEVRTLISNGHGGIAHCTLRKGAISKAVRHKTVSEFWHILQGNGAIWRKNLGKESVTPLKTGVSIDIPVGTEFQYRSDGGNLVFLCITMPPWPGAEEVTYIEQGAWSPTLG